MYEPTPELLPKAPQMSTFAQPGIRAENSSQETAEGMGSMGDARQHGCEELPRVKRARHEAAAGVHEDAEEGGVDEGAEHASRGEEDSEDEEEMDEHEEQPEDGDDELDALPDGAMVTSQAQAALAAVLRSWPRGHIQGSAALEAEEPEELEGAALVRVARAAWVAAGETPEQANKLAGDVAGTATTRYMAPCLTLDRFTRIFLRMACARAAAAAAMDLLATAHGASRDGKAAVAAAALRDASRIASSGLPSASEQGEDQNRGTADGPQAAIRAAAADTELHASSEDARLVLAPRCCIEARLKLAQLLLLDPSDQQDLCTAEALLVRGLEVLDAASSASDPSSSGLEDSLGGARDAERTRPKLRSLSEVGKAALSKLCMLLCQEGRDEEARGFLSALGCRYRLSTAVLHYSLGPSSSSPADAAAGAPTLGAPAEASRYVKALDHVVPPHIMALMRACFAPDAAFWREHGYSQDSPYFSYVHPLGGPPQSALDQVIRHIHQVALEHFPAVAEAKFAEWWAHNRPHGSGHQMHFDSDNEGVGEVRNPIISTVLYLTGSGIGGPTLVTDQAFSSTQLATTGWFVHPVSGRLTMFDGSVLHGVVPGRGPSPHPGERRVTFMVAFWKDIRTRPRHDGLPGASQPFPSATSSNSSTGAGRGAEGLEAAKDATKPGVCSSLPGPECFATSMVPAHQHTWPAALPVQDGPGWVEGVSEAACSAAASSKAVLPRVVRPVWEAVNPGARNKGLPAGLPKYSVCFQGF